MNGFILKQIHGYPCQSTMQKLGSFAKGFRWKKDNESRTVAFNLVVPIVGNNIDLYLFNHEPTDFSNKKIA